MHAVSKKVKHSVENTIIIVYNLNMILKRKFYDYLLNWKKTKKTECLVVGGARQVGKTYIISEFGKREYKSFIYINFNQNETLKEIFVSPSNHLLTTEQIYKNIQIYVPNSELIEHDTLIFLDEIQKCDEARTALKFLAIDNKYDVIASGSLLGLIYSNRNSSNFSIPVGYEQQVKLYSLDFEEFLWALGYSKESINVLREYFNNNAPVPSGLNETLESLFLEYMVVGGMPEAIANYAQFKNFENVNKIQLKILNSYKEDIVTYARNDIEKNKIRSTYDSIPRQLSKENKKFQYSYIDPPGKSKNYFDAINWLVDSNLTYQCFNVFEPKISLYGNEKKDQFKLYFLDTGLLMALYGEASKRALLTSRLSGNTKGAVFENVIGELLTKKGYTLHYYKKDNSSMEIEFLIEQDVNVIPIEVKAQDNSSISLNNYIKIFNPPIAYKLTSGNVGLVDKKKTIPHYMIMFL